MSEVDPLVQTWQIHNRIHRYLLSDLKSEHLAAPLEKGRAVGAQFAHIHNVRLMWLKVAMPEEWAKLTKIEKGAIDGDSLMSHLEASGLAIERLLESGIANGGKIKNFKPHVTAFLGYLISHESHHRGQIEVALRQAGLPLTDKASFGIWEWGVR